MESGSAAPIVAPSAGSVVDGAAAAAAAASTTSEVTPADAAADAVAAEMAEHLSIGGTAEKADASARGPVDLAADGDVYSCKDCSTQLGLAADIISKAFRCKHGKAYLFDKVVNVNVGAKEDRMMVTGLHTLCDISCVGCGTIVGWKYEFAHEKSQKYKEGKYILERYMLVGPDGSLYSIGDKGKDD